MHRSPSAFAFQAWVWLWAFSFTQLSANTAVTPSLRPDYSLEQRTAWLKRHEEFVAIAKSGDVDLLFLGDSITDYWRSRGKAVWDREFAPFRAANFGISGDRTQQVLWRIENGELDGISPKVIVLMIGTNNTDPGLGENSLTPRNTTPEIIAGVTAIVQVLQKKIPAATILLFGIFPRGEKVAPIRLQVAEINAGLAKLQDGRRVRFFDLGPNLRAADGTLSIGFMPDLLHLNEDGYKIWAGALQPPVAELLGAKSEGGPRPPP